MLLPRGLSLGRESGVEPSAWHMSGADAAGVPPTAHATGTVLDAGRGVDDDGAVPKVTTPHTQKGSVNGRRVHRRRCPFLIGASAHGLVESIGDMVYARQGDTAAGDRVGNNIASRIFHIPPNFLVDQ